MVDFSIHLYSSGEREGRLQPCRVIKAGKPVRIIGKPVTKTQLGPQVAR